MHYPQHIGAPALLTIDLGAIRENYERIASMVGAVPVAAVVKADAYGLGGVEIALELADAGCRNFFVAHLNEAEPLINALPSDARVFILNGLAVGGETACMDMGAIPVLNSLDQIRRWQEAGKRAGRELHAALQVDTGMFRLGLSIEEISALVLEPAQLDGIKLLLTMSHLACADETDNASNDAQRQEFDKITACLPAVPQALSNSAGAFLGSDFHYDLIRAGIALYGGNPADGANPMRAAIRLEAAVIQVRELPPHAGLGYGLTAAAATGRRIATVPVGYADGWPRSLGNRGAVFIDGQRVPIVGRVSMDSLMVDVSDLPAGAVCAGTIVELLGPNQTIDDVARDAGTISYEILTRLGWRYARSYTPATTRREQRKNAA